MRGKTHNRRRRSKKQHKRSRKVQHAGAYIYSGAYGCAFGKPPLKCLDEPSRRGDDIVSKALTRITGRQELSDSEKFRRIDPHQRYFLAPQKLCSLDTADIRPEDETDRCPKLDDPDPDEKFTHLLLSSNGGQNLNAIQLNYEDYLPFFESLTNLFDGLELAHTRGVSHCDIKPANIVSMKNPDGRFITRYIDFGLSKDHSYLPRYQLSIFDNSYYYWPLETVFYYYTTPDQGRYERVLRDFYTTLRSYNVNAIPQRTYFFPDGTNRFSADGLRTVVDPLDKNDRIQAVKWVDIYSLGLTLAEVYYKFIPQSVKTAADGTPYAEIAIKIPLATDPQFREIMDWHIEVQNRITLPLSNLIYNMIHIVPQRRPTPLAAKAEYEAILPAMRDLFTKKNLFKGLKPTGQLGFTPNPPTPTPLPPLSPTNLGKIQVSPVPNRVRPRRDPRVEGEVPPNLMAFFDNAPNVSAAAPRANNNLIAFFNNVPMPGAAAPRLNAANNNLAYAFENSP